MSSPIFSFIISYILRLISMSIMDDLTPEVLFLLAVASYFFFWIVVLARAWTFGFLDEIGDQCFDPLDGPTVAPAWQSWLYRKSGGRLLHQSLANLSRWVVDVGKNFKNIVDSLDEAPGNCIPENIWKKEYDRLAATSGSLIRTLSLKCRQLKNENADMAWRWGLAVSKLRVMEDAYDQLALSKTQSLELLDGRTKQELGDLSRSMDIVSRQLRTKTEEYDCLAATSSRTIANLHRCMDVIKRKTTGLRGQLRAAFLSNGGLSQSLDAVTRQLHDMAEAKAQFEAEALVSNRPTRHHNKD